MVRNETIEVGKIKLNPLSYTVVVDEEEVMLTSTQFAILKILMENAGKVVSRESLIIRIWGYDFDGDERVIDNHIKKLRRFRPCRWPNKNRVQARIQTGGRD